MAHVPNHTEREDRRVSATPKQGGKLTLNSDPYGIKGQAIGAVTAPIAKGVSSAIGSAMPAALGGGGAGMAALTPLMGPLALAGIAGKVFGFFNEGTPDVKEQAQEMYQAVTDDSKRAMRAPMQYAKGIDYVGNDFDPYDREKELEYKRMFRDRKNPLDGALEFPEEIDPYFFDDSRRMMPVPPVQMAIPVFKKGFNPQRSEYYRNRLMKQQPNVDPSDHREIFFNRLPTPKPVMKPIIKTRKLNEGTQYAGMDEEEFYEYLRLTDPNRFSPLDGILRFPRELNDSDDIDDPSFVKDPFDMASNTLSPAYDSIPIPSYQGDPNQLELFPVPGLPTQSYEEKLYFQDADRGMLKANKGTPSVDPRQLELFAFPGRQGQSYEEKVYYQNADAGKYNRGTPAVSMPADPFAGATMGYKVPDKARPLPTPPMGGMIVNSPRNFVPPSIPGANIPGGYQFGGPLSDRDIKVDAHRRSEARKDRESEAKINATYRPGESFEGIGPKVTMPFKF